MKKKIVIISLIFLLIGLVIWRVRRKKVVDLEVEEKPSSSSQEDKEEYQYQWVDWEDPAGFSFQYPEKVEVNNHPDDEDNYAYLTISHSDYSGEITITCSDSEYEDIDDWLENDEEVKEADSLETEVASIPGRKLALGQGREMSAFIDWDDVLYTIKIEAQDQDYWRPVYKQILESFKLIPLEGETEAQFEEWFEDFNTAGVDVVEPVEVIE